MQYEKNPGNGDYTYLTKAFYIQSDGNQYGNRARKIAGKVLWCTDTTVFEEEGGCGDGADSLRLPQFPTGKNFIDKFNEHFGICGVFAHGYPYQTATATQGYDASKRIYNFTSMDSLQSGESENGNGIDNMTNNIHPSIFYSISCHTNSYDYFKNINHYPTIGYAYTCISLGGGPAYLGNTRGGYADQSEILFERFVQYIYRDVANIGIAQAMSKTGAELFGFIADPSVRMGHNLTGCPEMDIWTAIPSTFNNVQITDNNNTVTVNTGGVDSCKICIMSLQDTGATFYEVRDFVSSATFTNIVTPYIVTITKHNYIPYLQALPDEYIQNETFTTTETRIGNNIYAGNSVTNNKPQGDVIIRNGAKLKLKAQNNVFLENGFEVENGGILEVNTNVNN